MLVTIIIVEDHPIVRMGLEIFFSLDREIEVVGFAVNGVEAVEKTHRLKPDIVIMDINLPEMDGLEATRLIKLDRPITRVIVWTGGFTDYINTKALAAGAECCLTKGTDNSKLLQAIKK